MPKPTVYGLDAASLATQIVEATSTRLVKDLLTKLPIVPDDEYTYDKDNPSHEWQTGKLHWFPVGNDRGNAGRIKLAGFPENPIAERTVNSMEALIELERRRELSKRPQAPPPPNPREAVHRYFDLPSLDELPRMTTPIRGQKPQAYAREMAKRIRIKLVRSMKPVEYSVVIEDDGIGQGPEKMHARLLSLGSSDKGDKPYLIGVFGQGGSSAYQASKVSWLVSRRAADVRGREDGDGFGWTFVRHIFTKGRRDPYYAYLAAHPDGRVPELPASVEKVLFEHGTRIAHIAYDFGKMEPARTLYAALNHLLFKPVLPYELYTKKPGELPDPMWGNSYRLSRQYAKNNLALDKTFQPQAIEKKGGER